MRISFVHIVALAFMAWPGFGPAQTRADCDADPLTCLSEAVVLIEESGAGDANKLGLRVAYIGALARSGEFERAGVVADTLNRPRDIVPAQLALANSLGAAGQVAAASAAIAKALEAANRTEYPSLRLDMLADIARVQMLAGDTVGASASLAPVMAELEAMPAGFRRNALIIKAIKSGVLFQDIEAAQALAYSIDAAYDWDEPILEIAYYLAGKGQPDLGLAEILKIENSATRMSALTAYVLESTDIGQNDVARDAVGNTMVAAYRDGTPTSRAFITIRAITALTKLGDESASAQIRRAFSLAQGGLSRTSYAGFIVELSVYYSISGQHARAVDVLEVALRTAEEIDDENVRIFPIGEVVAAFARHGATGRAFEIVQSAQDADTRALWLLLMADELG
ncbi:MAG: hypothetical protein GQ535_01190 [Rhodobacteraceae bacterium]|nr:hypothetical protein [Paracoccaceae bacterium]